jgi:hypothetical protein
MEIACAMTAVRIAFDMKCLLALVWRRYLFINKESLEILSLWLGRHQLDSDTEIRM